MDLKIISKFSVFLFLCISFSIGEKTYAASAWSSAITRWNGNCSGSTRTWWDDMCMAWRKKMGNKGWTQYYANYSYVTANRFIDKKIFSWGNDRFNIDYADAGLICTHGGYNNSGWYGVMHTKNNGHCNLDRPEMRFGPKNNDGNLRFFHMSSCNSMRWEHKLKWFGVASDRVHLITGFHGYMYIGSRYVDEYRDLANKGYSSKGVGKTWVDEMHHVDHWYNAWKTICPISLGFGGNSAQAVNAQNERYSSNYSDKSNSWVSWRWKKGCDPENGYKLPN